MTSSGSCLWTWTSHTEDNGTWVYLIGVNVDDVDKSTHSTGGMLARRKWRAAIEHDRLSEVGEQSSPRDALSANCVSPALYNGVMSLSAFSTMG